MFLPPFLYFDRKDVKTLILFIWNSQPCAKCGKHLFIGQNKQQQEMNQLVFRSNIILYGSFLLILLANERTFFQIWLAFIDRFRLNHQT